MKNKYKNDYKIIQKDQIDLRTLWKVLIGNWRSLLTITLSFVFLTLFYLFFATPLFYSNSTLYNVEQKNTINKLTSLASIAGADLGVNSQSSNVDLVDYALSRRLKNQIIEQKWFIKDNDIHLTSFWKIDDTTGFVYSLKNILSSISGNNQKLDELKRLRWKNKTLKKLNDRIVAGYNTTGLLKVEVWMEDPFLAQSIANFIVNSTVQYTNDVKMDSWSRTREFYIKRLDEVKIELDIAEQIFTNFQKENRRVIDSPDLIAKLANLKRDLEIKTALYITLQNEYEFARIEETKDLTGIKVLDEAEYPIEVNRPKKKILLFLGMFVGSILSLPIFLINRAFKNSI